MFIRRTKFFFQSIIRHHHIYLDRYDLSSTGISLNEFQQRRQSLVNLIRKFPLVAEKNFLICLPACTKLYMGPDVMYFPFKQQADFYYLTGCLQPDAMFILNGNQQQFTTHLFLPKLSDEHYERWHGEIITDKDEICQLFGIDYVSSIEEFSTFKFSSSSSIVFYDSQTMDSINVKKENFNQLRRKISSLPSFPQLNIFLHALRAIKSSIEQNLIRQACQIATQGFIQTIKNCPKNTSNESFIQSRFQYECQILPDISMAFHPVVAANGRSNVIHYHKNNQIINDDDLIMLDGGCLFKQYSSDITRLWPINGRFSPSQRQLYEILLTVQKDIIQYIHSREKIITRRELNILTDQYMIKYLREEMILSRTIDDQQAKKIINYLSPTSVSHHLGLDVHDCESLAFSYPLQSGNVITIEPGLYIPWHYSEIPLNYRGFASRIEDDILITDQGCEILTRNCPKEIEDLYSILDQRIHSTRSSP